jgi:hypothetical protein
MKWRPFRVDKLLPEVPYYRNATTLARVLDSTVAEGLKGFGGAADGGPLESMGNGAK